MLDVDDAVAEGEEHADVAVAEVVEGWFWRLEVGGFDGAVDGGAGGFALDAGAASGCEDEGGGAEACPALVEELEEAGTSDRAGCRSRVWIRGS